MADTTHLDRSAVGTIEIDDGAGFDTLGLIREATVRINGEEVKHFDVSTYPIGPDLVMFGSLDVEIEFVWEEIADYDLWNRVIHGGTVTTTTAGTTAVTDESITLDGDYTAGEWNSLAFSADFDQDCTVSVGSAVSGGGTTYTEAIDYIIDRKGGHLGRVPGGNISDGDTVYIDYVYNTWAGKYFAIMADTTTIQEYAIRMVKPLLNGDNIRIQHTKAQLATTIEFPLTPGDTGEWAGVTTKLTFLKDSGGTYGTYGRWEIYTP